MQSISQLSFIEDNSLISLIIGLNFIYFTFCMSCLKDMDLHIIILTLNRKDSENVP